MNDKLLNIKEVAAYLGLSEEKVKELVSAGHIPAYKVAGLILRFKKEQVDQHRRKMVSGDFKRPVSSPFQASARKGSLQHIFTEKGANAAYSFTERLEDFLYYNDFYILSFILLALILFAIFEI